MKHIYEAQDLNLRFYKKKVRTDWFLIIALIVMLVIVSGIYLYVEKGSLGIVSEFPQGGKVALVTVEKNYWGDYCEAFPKKCIY